MSDFRHAELSDLAGVTAWIETAEACHQWAGERVSFPIQLETLSEQIEFQDADSWLLLRSGAPAGFGQIVPKPDGRLHLARLLIAQGQRSRGLGRKLTEQLLAVAVAKSPTCVSLNVFLDNRTALKLYRSLGFEAAQRPGGELDSLSQYMTLEAGRRTKQT